MTLPTSWTFAAPARLLLLLGVVVLLVAYLWRQRRRTAYEMRFTQVELLASVVSRGSAWRRHLPVGLLISTLVLLTTAFAQPSDAVTVRRDKATVILALDTSSSMLVEDIAPTRIVAAKAAAQAFVTGLPDSFAVGLISFNVKPTLVQAPTTDHAAVSGSIASLPLRGGTRIGDAVVAAVKAAKIVPQTPGEPAAPVTIVLLSDGINSGGTPVRDAAQQAVDAGYPVTTIAYGTNAPALRLGDRTVSAAVDAAGLATLAQSTGGKAYRALSATELTQIYGDISSRAGTVTQKRELSSTLTGIALLSAMAASAASLVWFRVLP